MHTYIYIYIFIYMCLKTAYKSKAGTTLYGKTPPPHGKPLGNPDSIHVMQKITYPLAKVSVNKWHRKTVGKP